MKRMSMKTTSSVILLTPRLKIGAKVRFKIINPTVPFLLVTVLQPPRARSAVLTWGRDTVVPGGLQRPLPQPPVPSPRLRRGGRPCRRHRGGQREEWHLE